MSFLEMLDVVNEGLIKKGEDAIAFDSDCREGICGMCSLVVNGVPHGPTAARPSASSTCAASRTATRSPIEPWRAKAFPVVKDLVVDRSAFDRIIAAGGYVSVNCGGAPDGNAIPISEGRGGSGDGLGRLHRLRRLRRGVQERVGAPLHERQDLAPGAAAAGPGRARRAASSRWSSRPTPKASAAARTKASAKRSARRRFRSRTSRG